MHQLFCQARRDRSPYQCRPRLSVMVHGEGWPCGKLSALDHTRSYEQTRPSNVKSGTCNLMLVGESELSVSLGLSHKRLSNMVTRSGVRLIVCAVCSRAPRRRREPRPATPGEHTHTDTLAAPCSAWQRVLSRQRLAANHQRTLHIEAASRSWQELRFHSAQPPRARLSKTVTRSARSAHEGLKGKAGDCRQRLASTHRHIWQRLAAPGSSSLADSVWLHASLASRRGCIMESARAQIPFGAAFSRPAPNSRSSVATDICFGHRRAHPP